MALEGDVSCLFFLPNESNFPQQRAPPMVWERKVKLRRGDLSSSIRTAYSALPRRKKKRERKNRKEEQQRKGWEGRKGKEEGGGKLFISATVATPIPPPPPAGASACSVSRRPPQYSPGGPGKGTE